jgi:periplasmic copper chaperone A
MSQAGTFRETTIRAIIEAFAALLLLVVIGLVPAAVRADPVHLGDLVIDQAWIRPTPAAAPVAGGYLTITNSGDKADRLTAVSADFAASSEIHEMKMEGQVMKMRPIDGGLSIKPGQTIELKPGGFHIMFMKPKQPMVEGETHKVTLEFERAGTVELEFSVRQP